MRGRETLPHALAKPGGQSLGRGTQVVERRHRVDVAVVEERGELEQLPPGGDEVERHALGVELVGDDLDRDPPAVTMRGFGRSQIGEQMMRRLESGMNLDPIASHAAIVADLPVARRLEPRSRW